MVLVKTSGGESSSSLLLFIIDFVTVLNKVLEREMHCMMLNRPSPWTAGCVPWRRAAI